MRFASLIFKSRTPKSSGITIQNSRLILFVVFLIFNHLPANSQILDDFSIKYFNNFGQIRYGHGGMNVNVTFPRPGLIIPTQDDKLIEPLVSQDSGFDLTDKYLKLVYTASDSHTRPFTVSSHKSSIYEGANNQHLSYVFLHQGQYQVVIIPFSYLILLDMAFCHAIAIGGPLIVHQLDLIDAVDDLTTLIPQSLVQNRHRVVGPELYRGRKRRRNSNALSFRPKVFPTHPPLLEYKHVHANVPFQNRNSLGFCRGGLGIAKVPTGVNINTGGYLFENLDSNTINLNRKYLRLIVSTRSPTIINIILQYRQSSAQSSTALSSSYAVPIHAVNDTPIDVPFALFPGIRYQDAARIWISGPITIHSIMLGNRYFPFQTSFPDNDHSLVDDLSSWPESLVESKTVIQLPKLLSEEDHLFNFNSNRFNSGLNDMSYPSVGRGVSALESGIELSETGFIIEQLAPRNGVYDLSNAQIEIEYSAEFESVRKLKVLSVVPNNDDNHFHYQPAEFDLHFVKSVQNTIMIKVGECGLVGAFFITGHGQVKLHQIRLHHTTAVPVRLTLSRVLVVDTFCDWPLLIKDSNTSSSTSLSNVLEYNLDEQLPVGDPMMVDSTPARFNPTNLNLGVHEKSVASITTNDNDILIFDYRQTHCQPVMNKCKYIHNVGWEIPIDGTLTLPLPTHRGAFVFVTYSVSCSGTREVRILATRGLLVANDVKYVAFQSGSFQTIAIPAPLMSVPRDAVRFGISVSGPLTVHQVKLIDTVPVLDPLPGKGAADALLIDDFSDWDQQQIQLNSYLFTLGPNGLGSVTLRRDDQYLMESFAGNWDHRFSSSLAFRITYTARRDVVCQVSTFPEVMDDVDAQDPYNSLTLHFENVWFQAGVQSKTVVTVNDLLKNRARNMQSSMLMGLIIHGPAFHRRRQYQALTIHRIELIARTPFAIPVTRFPLVMHRAGQVLKSSSVVKGPDFVTKQANLQEKLSSLRSKYQFPLPVDRAYMLQSACQIIQMSPKELLKTLNVLFLGESGQDVGGLTREFFTLMAKAMNNQDYGLFNSLEDANYALQINPESDIQDDYLQHFRIIGRVIGMAILSENLIGIRLVPSLYWKLTNPPCNQDNELADLAENDNQVPDVSELATIDPDKWRSLTWILEHDITSVSKYYEWTMTTEWHRHTETKTIDLVKDGGMHAVTESNKNQYVRLYADWLIFGQVEAQANALRDGVWDVIPREYLAPFNETELEILIAGTDAIDVDDWEQNTNYKNIYDSKNAYEPDDLTIKHFWSCVRSFTADQRTQLLVFVTGSPRLPSTGFKDLKPMFSIYREPEKGKLPHASTCFNILYLSPYSDPKVLCERLAYSILPQMGSFTLA